MKSHCLGGDARTQKRKSLNLSQAKPFPPGPQSAMAEKISSSFFWLLVLLPLPLAQEGRHWEPEPPRRLGSAVLGWPSTAPGSVRRLLPVQSLAQLSVVVAKLNLKAKGLYLETYTQDRKESSILFLSPCKKCKEVQEGVRKTSSPFASLRIHFFN